MQVISNITIDASFFYAKVRKTVLINRSFCTGFFKTAETSSFDASLSKSGLSSPVTKITGVFTPSLRILRINSKPFTGSILTSTIARLISGDIFPDASRPSVHSTTSSPSDHPSLLALLGLGDRHIGPVPSCRRGL